MELPPTRVQFELPAPYIRMPLAPQCSMVSNSDASEPDREGLTVGQFGSKGNRSRLSAPVIG